MIVLPVCFCPPVGNAWASHGLLMEYLLATHVLLTRYPRDTPRWASHGHTMGGPWVAHGRPPWATDGLLVGYRRPATKTNPMPMGEHGLPMGYPWVTYRLSPWATHGFPRATNGLQQKSKG